MAEISFCDVCGDERLWESSPWWGIKLFNPNDSSIISIEKELCPLCAAHIQIILTSNTKRKRFSALVNSLTSGNSMSLSEPINAESSPVKE